MENKEKEKFPNKLKSFALSFRVWLAVFFVIISAFLINYTYNTQGLAIVGIAPNSLAESSGFQVKENIPLRNLEIIKKIENTHVNSQKQFFEIIENSNKDEITITTTQNIYTIDITNISPEKYDKELGFSFRSVPSSNIKLGIELEGGSQFILRTKEKVSEEQFETILVTLQNRLNIYGASGTKVNSLENSFSDEKFIFIESTSSNKNDIFKIIERKGEFEAKIGNTSVFTGNNVQRVLDDPQNSRISCPSTQKGNYMCNYELSVKIDKNGTQKFFDKTKTLDVVGEQLSEEVCFYLDKEEITCLTIASTFKYNKISTPQISGGAEAGETLKEAQKKAKEEKDFMKAILSTQSLPTELEVVQSYSITPTLGEELLENAIIVGIASLLVVCGIVALRYKKFGVFIGIFIALLAEIIIVLGIAAFLKISIDLAAIGGLIAAIGTGVDDQIIITDEYFRKQNRHKSANKKVKYAFTIILIAYFTTLSAMLPLMFGLKLLQGFAFMTIIGVTIGVLITRPLYGAYLKIITTTQKQRDEEREEENN